MADPPDLEALARRYLDLWQDQLSAVPDDPELRDGLARLFEGSAAVPDLGRLGSTAPELWGPFWGLLPALMLTGSGANRGERTTGRGRDGRPDQQNTVERQPGTAERPAPPADAPDDRARRLDQLEARLGALEERIDRLASGLEGAGGAAPEGPRRGRS